jgi:PEP-CTERM motif
MIMKIVRRSCLLTAAMIACLGIAGAASAGPVHLTFVQSEVDVIPLAQSAETDQNSEPSLAVNPRDPTQMIAGSFDGGTRYWQSNNFGQTWSDFGNLTGIDKSIAWRQDGAAALATTLAPGFVNISTFQSGAANFGAAINVFPGPNLDQPWVRTGPSVSGPAANVYVAYNNDANVGLANGKTAAINISTNNGNTYPTVVSLDPVGGKAICIAFNCARDSPSVRQAVNGGTVYAIYTRYDSKASETVDGIRLNSTVGVAKSTNFGQTFSAATPAANPIDVFTLTQFTSSAYSLGNERVGSNNAIAVDPNDANHIVVAYVDSPAEGQMQVVVSDSKDGAATWTEKFRTPLNVRSALPGLTILDNGQIGLLYGDYAPATNKLSQHLVVTFNDFATTDEEVLATETNNFPPQTFAPYIGDFFDLTSIGDTFYGIFSASNADDGTLASYLFDDLFQRDFIGTPGKSGFELIDLLGNHVGFSIDPIFFSAGPIDPPDVPEPGTLALLAGSLFAFAALRRRK